MEEKKNTPQNPPKENPKTEIDSLLKEMINKNTAPEHLKDGKELVSPQPAKDKTPLDNLKGILSQIDAKATDTKPINDKVRMDTPSTQSAQEENKVIVKPQETIQPSAKDETDTTCLPAGRFLFDSDAVARLDGLIKAHRAKNAPAIQ